MELQLSFFLFKLQLYIKSSLRKEAYEKYLSSEQRWISRVDKAFFHYLRNVIVDGS